MRKIKKLNIFLLILLVIAILTFSALDNNLSIAKYEFNSDKVPQGEKVRIVFIADLHNQSFGNDEDILINMVKVQSPDLILLGGDFIYAISKTDMTIKFLKGIKGVAPIYFVTGNHEYWTKCVEKVKTIITDCGVKILEDKVVQLNIKNIPIMVYGLEDPDKKGYQDENYNQPKSLEMLWNMNKDKVAYKILLAHRPELIEMYKKYEFNLVLSGHTHGGQVRIPFILNGLYAPNQGDFPKYAGGLYRFGQLNLVVSRGLYINPKLLRIFNPPEIDVIDIIH